MHSTSTRVPFQRVPARPVPFVRAALAGAALAALAGCGAISDSGAGCSVNFSVGGMSTLSAGVSRLTYRADLSDECRTFLSEKSGAAKVKLVLSGVTDAKIALESASAGERSRSFDTSKFTMAFGSIDTTIDSGIYTDWALPWKDKPSTMSVQLQVPSTLTDSQRPLVTATISQ